MFENLTIPVAFGLMSSRMSCRLKRARRKGSAGRIAGSFNRVASETG